MAKANLVVWVGLGLDPWMDALAATATPKPRALRVGDRVPTIVNDDGTIDPHVWMDPQRARLIVTAVAEELARTDSSHANAFRERASALDATLAALDHELEARTATWGTRAFSAPHGGMAYYADRYGLRVDGAARSAPVEATEPGPAGATYEGAPPRRHRGAGERSALNEKIRAGLALHGRAGGNPRSLGRPHMATLDRQVLAWSGGRQ